MTNQVSNLDQAEAMFYEQSQYGEIDLSKPDTWLPDYIECYGKETESHLRGLAKEALKYIG